MIRPAIFFDRDNTLIVSDGYLGDAARVELVPGAADAVARARAMGFATVVVSNQSGVARGMFGEDAVRAVNACVDDLLKAQNPAAIIDVHEFCPFHPQAVVERYRLDNDLRKPRPGMLLAAARKLDLDLPRSWMIGDSPRDVEAGSAAGCRTILFQAPALSPSPAAAAASSTRPTYVATTLQEAMNIIERNTACGTQTPAPTNPAPPAPASSRLEVLAEQILMELQRRNEQIHTDFSASKLLAGITQVIVLAVLFLTYLKSATSPTTIPNGLLLAIMLQTLTIALLIMSRHR